MAPPKPTLLALLAALGGGAALAVRPHALGRAPYQAPSFVRLANPRGPKMALPLAPVPVLPSGLLPIPGLFPEGVLLSTVLFTSFAATGQKMLTTAGLVHAWILAVILWSSLGWRGFLTGVFYLFCGSSVTKVGKEKKEALGIAEGRGGQRGPENVWGAAATAAMCALAFGSAQKLVLCLPVAASLGIAKVRSLLLIGVIASFATKLGDTSASEIGKVYGKTTYLATTFRKVCLTPRRDAMPPPTNLMNFTQHVLPLPTPCPSYLLHQVPPGTEGAVSLEGTLAGIAGSLLLCLFGVVFGMMPASAIAPCVFAAWCASHLPRLGKVRPSFDGAVADSRCRVQLSRFSQCGAIPRPSFHAFVLLYPMPYLLGSPTILSPSLVRQRKERKEWDGLPMRWLTSSTPP